LKPPAAVVSERQHNLHTTPNASCSAVNRSRTADMPCDTSVFNPEDIVKNQAAVMIRYIGADHARRYVLQRGDYKFWTGHGGWSKILDCAKVFYDHGAAQKACAAIQYRQYEGKPLRTFKIELAVTLVADDVADISRESLVKYIAEALRIDVENSVYGDGPVEGSFVQARLRLETLEETRRHRRNF
jgi:hypothetical protein